MRVLKKVNVERKHKCPYCRSIFAYKEEDIDRAFDNRAICPVCRKLVSVSIFDRKVRRKK